MLQTFHPWVVCEYRHSRHIPCFLLCARHQLSRHCTSALLSSASCVLSALRCQLTCRKSIFDICELIQNHPRPNRDSTKNRLFFPPPTANTEKSSLLTQVHWWLLHIKKRASLTELTNQGENGEACICMTHVFSVRGGVAIPINQHNSTPLQPVRLCTDCHQGKLHWLVILFTCSFNYTNIKRETFFFFLGWE